ncbi:DUF1045 domain-containing protein [Acidocella sp.]|uniref:DUF1045 domain-containing protein n=1 Tax=Acidocella sp. TaxID=50710 RepID=UPI002618447B|nr:DUF1045 domain-containing protein [Acidocella sp.]
MANPYRAAIYYAPETDDPLWRQGSAWLGRDAATGLNLPQPALPNLPANTEAPRRYGFHATLKAPLSLRFGLKPFLADAEALAAALPPFALPPLIVTSLNGFLALCLATPSPALHTLETVLVRGLDRHRLPEDAQTQAQRAQGRTPRQRAYIARYGYPLVIEEFLFHMTLTAALSPNPYHAPAEAHFGPALSLPRRVESLCLFTQHQPGAPFRLIRRLKLGG